ncbi:MAG: alpha/beta hydrolase [Deltaproteobacteria bacterium]|nr:alpha/beta hydrolase [Deltaproteobacteria bacterium]
MISGTILDETSLTVRGLKLSALISQGPASNPLICLHGWLDNAASFEGLAQFLSPFRLIMLDLPGHGLSQHRPGGSYHFADYLIDVVAVADLLGLERFSLLGHSLGANIALLTAGLIPERINQLFLIEGIGPSASSPAENLIRLRTHIKQGQSPLYQTSSLYESFDAALKARLAYGRLSEESATRLLKRGLEKTKEGFRVRSDPNLKKNSPLYLNWVQIRTFLKAVKAESLFISGRDAKILKPAETIRNAKQLNRLNQLVLPGFHHLHLDDPEPTAKAILDFHQTNDYYTSF